MANRSDDKKKVRCSFCNKSQEQVRKLIAGPNVYICDECIEICSEIIQDEFDNEPSDSEINLLKPKEIKEFLSVAHPTVVGIVSRLEQNGFITFHPDSADKRNKVVVLTEKAVRVDKEMKEIIRRQDEKLFASLSQEQVKELTFLLQTIYENLNTEEEDTPC